MGFVKAGDWLDWMDGQIEAKQIRELCGICVNKAYPGEQDQ
jgi:chemotaxis regulatin CheY-phosphate phosphatase CheZ